MRKAMVWLAVCLTIAALLAQGCGRHKAQDASATGPVAAAPGTPAAPGATPGQAPDANAPAAKGGDMKKAFEDFQKQYPGTAALTREVRGLQAIESDPKGATLTGGQAKIIAPIIKDILSKPKLTQDDANKAVSTIEGCLTSEQKDKVDAARRARMGGGKGGPGGGKGGAPGAGGPGGGAPGGMGGGKGGAMGGGKGGGRGMDWINTMTPDKNPFLEGRLNTSASELLKTLESKAK